jgi:beta-lactam-binding protein with PASTA domain
VNRNGLLERDNGVCKNTYSLEFFGGAGPSRVATCKPNEVEIPDMIGKSLATAKSKLESWPLTPAVVYKPAKTGDRVGYVVGQTPKRGTASAYDKITLISEKSLHGVVPRVIGLSRVKAERKLAKLHMNVSVKGGSSGKVVAQSKPPRTASAPGEEIVLTVKSS